MARHIPLEPIDELHGLLEEAGVNGQPREGRDEATLQGVLALALFLAERQKRVDFSDFSWEDPRFVARDAKIDIEIVHATLEGSDKASLKQALDAALTRPRMPMGMVALDARRSGITEFELGHHLYGEVTLSTWPHRPSQSSDLRIDQARERGWTRTLKEHNLLPGRGIVVLDEHHGLLLTDPTLDRLIGVIVLLPTNHVVTMLNPFVHDEVNVPELEHWLAWGPGTAATEWRVVLDVQREDDPPREDAP